jgi:hypothetical protein
MQNNFKVRVLQRINHNKKHSEQLMQEVSQEAFEE